MGLNTRVAALAIDGGQPVRSAPLPPRMMIDSRETAAVDALMRRVTTEGGSFDRYDGPEVDQLEADLAEYFGVKYVTAVSSGTAAVQSALGALDLDPGSEVITSSMTDPGAVMPLFFMGLIPVFVDHDVDTMLMSPEAIEAAITKRTGAIIATHLYGFICDMDTIQRIARAHGIPVIGDASQAHAGKYHGSLSAPFGDIGAVSTMAWKHMTTGGQGGFVATDREDLYWAAKRFADRGKPFNQDASSNTGMGLNYRMTELAAVVGRVQLRKLSDVADRRRAIYDALCAGVAETRTMHAATLLPDTTPTPYVIPFAVDVDALGVTNEYFAQAVTAEGIPATPGDRHLIYTKEFMLRKKSFGSTFFPFGYALPTHVTDWTVPANPGVAELARTVILLSPHEDWKESEISDTIEAFKKVESSIGADR